MAQPPNLKIPTSLNMVSVRIIGPTSHIGRIPLCALRPTRNPKLHHSLLSSILFPHRAPVGRKLLFDLGVRRDQENFAPRIVNGIKDGDWDVTVKQGVQEQLEANDVNRKDIEGINME